MTKSVLLFVFAFYFILSILHSYPLIFHMSDHVISFGGDTWQYVWNLWWVKKVFVELRSPLYFTSYLSYPFGVSLINDVIMPIRNSIGLPILLLTHNIIFTYNFLYLLALSFTCFSMFLLCFHLTKHSVSSFIGGFIFGISHFTIVNHTNLSDLYFLPLLLLSMLIYMEKRSAKYLIVTGLIWMGLFLTDYYQFFYGTVLIGLYLGMKVLFVKKLRKETLISAAKIFLIAAIFILPFFIKYLSDNKIYKFYDTADQSLLSPDIFSFFVPSSHLSFQPMVGIANVFKKIFPNLSWIAANEYFLRFTPLILFGFSIFAVRKYAFYKYILVILLVGFIFALGPYVKLAGEIHFIPGNFDTPLYLPYSILQHVPILNNLRAPGRFVILMEFALSILAAMGIKSLMEHRRRRKYSLSLLVVIFIAINLETLIIPLHLNEVFIPHVYYDIAKDGKDNSVLNVPIRVWSDDEKFLLYQTVHEKPIIGGLISRPSKAIDDSYYNTPLIKEILWYQYNNGLNTFQFDEDQKEYDKILNNWKIGYITFSYVGGGEIDPWRIKRIEEEVKKIVPLELMYQDINQTVYKRI